MGDASLRRARLVLGAVLTAAAVVLAAGAASVPLLDPDEARFARTSVEMLRSGDLVVPHFQGTPRLAKPPLLHWAQTLFFRSFGVAPWTARLHAILATLACALLVASVAARRFGVEGGIWAAAVLTTMPLVVVPGKLGTLDALLALHVFALVVLDLSDPEDGGGRYRAALAGALGGLAFLIKGPVGIVLPLLIVLAGRSATGRSVIPSTAAVSQALAGWAVVTLPWGLAFLRRIGGDETLSTLRREVLERYFAGTDHVEPFWFYGPVAAAGFLPWLAPLVLGMVRAVRLRKTPAARTALYAAAGLAAGLVFFSLGRSKVASYIVPLAPLAALLVTWELAREIEESHERVTGSALLSATLAGQAVLLGLAGAVQLEGVARTVSLAGAAILGTTALAAMAGALARRPRAVFGAAAGGTAVFLLVVGTTLFPAIGERKSAAALIEKAPELSAGRPLVTVEIKLPSLAFYADRAVETIEMAAWPSRLERQDGALFVLADVDLHDVPPTVRARLREVARHGKLLVFEASTATRRETGDP